VSCNIWSESGQALVPAPRPARIAGKDYVMQDGDVVEFRFNV
jgi:ribosome-binding ATPase YchF (GTP1/OBG family)